MKTSNKILLGAFLAIILIITGVHLALYAKIKSGDFIIEKRAAEAQNDSHALPGVRYVSVTGLTNCSVSYTNMPSLTVQQQNNSRLSYKVINDTLIIQGDSTTTIAEYEQGKRSAQRVELHLPSNVPVKLTYGSLQLAGGEDSANAPSWSVELARNAYLGVTQRDTDHPTSFFKQLNVVTNQSSVELGGNTMIDELNIRAIASNLMCQDASIKHVSMNVDSSSRISLSGANLKNLTNNLTP